MGEIWYHESVNKLLNIFMRQFFIYFIYGLILLLIIWGLIPGLKKKWIANKEKIAPLVLLYDIPVNNFEVVESTVQDGETLGEILNRYNISYQKILEIANQNKINYDFEDINVGNKYTIFISRDSLELLSHYIYEPDYLNFCGFSITDSLYFFQKQRDIEIRYKQGKGQIGSSLWNAMVENKLSPVVSIKLSEIFAWTVDFFKIQEEDKFNVFFEEIYVDGERFETGKILAAILIHQGKKFSAYYFEEDGGYYNQNGRNLKKDFLKAPLRYSRISSRYNPNRLHPVLKVRKAHLGTDYAAPTGTPIMSTADGVITKASYTRNNGNYVKVQHNSVYSTQYLHMSKIAKGIKSGIRVKQGQIIGYVGSTGLATGPHVCYRFWKNGNQVDPYKEDLPESNPVPSNSMARFKYTRDSLDIFLNISKL